MYTNDLAISAVSYDSMFVADIVTLLALRLRSTPTWADTCGSIATWDGLVDAPLQQDASRVVLVLWQRLWGTDDRTAVEAEFLRLRVRQSPRSILLVTLDDAVPPTWMSKLRHRSLATAGIDAVVDFVVGAIADAGGTVLPKSAPQTAPSLDATVRWPEPPPSFLRQTRAHSALRREIDSLGVTLQARVDAGNGGSGDGVWELHKLPHRIIARLDDVGVSFSWLPGRDGTVAGGRLMVIEWTGIAAGRGIAALRSAQPGRECVYRVDADGPDAWCWRADRPNGRASSTFNLASEWVAGAAMTTRALEARGAS